MEINIKNINRAITLMDSIPENRIDMSVYREDAETAVFSHECKSTGCVIGFSTVLDTPENLNQHTAKESYFDYDGWSESFFGVDVMSDEWDFMFCMNWPNNKSQIIKRLQWVADGKDIPKEYSYGMIIA